MSQSFLLLLLAVVVVVVVVIVFFLFFFLNLPLVATFLFTMSFSSFQ